MTLSSITGWQFLPSGLGSLVSVVACLISVSLGMRRYLNDLPIRPNFVLCTHNWACKELNSLSVLFSGVTKEQGHR